MNLIVSLNTWKANILPIRNKRSSSLLNCRKFYDFAIHQSAHSTDVTENGKSHFILGKVDIKKKTTLKKALHVISEFVLVLDFTKFAAIDIAGRTQH